MSNNIKKEVRSQVKKAVKKTAQKVKLSSNPFKKETYRGNYVIDTSVIAAKKLSELIEKKGLRGKIIVPDAAVAELEHQANTGRETGFEGLDELAKLHHLKHKYGLGVEFAPPRPTAHEIRYAKSGEIDALIRSLAYGRRATLVTSDYVQAKSAAAYGIKVWYIKVIRRPVKKRFSLFGR